MSMMINSNDELLRYIADDVQKYKEFRHFVKAGFWERFLVKRRPPNMLHPNPDDEFSMPQVGPHFGIINEYCARIAARRGVEKEQIEEALVVEKMSRDGYMLLNGHHRWAAALKMGMNSVPVQIVNLTHEEDHRRMLEKTTNDKRVIFDFDEVLCVSEKYKRAETDPRLPFGLFEKIYEERLRWGMPELIQELQNQNYDVWVYTKNYHSAEYIQGFLKTYKLEVEGIVNGVGQRKSKQAQQRFREMISRKYKLVYNVDNEGVVKICPGDKTFESYDLETSETDWANEVMRVIKNTSGES